MFGAELFTHRPRWMKLHLSVFSCITPKLVVYSFFSSLIFSLTLFLLSLSLCPHSCVSGLLKGFNGKIPVIFPCLVFSQQFCCLHMHLGEINLSCCLMVRAISMFIYQVKADILYVFCMCNLIDSNTQDSEVINNFFDNPITLTLIFQDNLLHCDWSAALHCIWIILLF